jgi:hypothetical protein
LFESAFADPKLSPDVSEDEELDSGSEYYSEFSYDEEVEVKVEDGDRAVYS